MVWVALFLGTFVAGFAVNVAIAYRMQSAVNQRVSKTDRLIWYKMWGSDSLKILRRHKSLFPSSSLRRWYFLSAVLIVVAFCLIALAARLSQS
ncbi:exported hypothetical protein [Candidatus Sulfotelmatobacter sp. SbA7]|nr:exported hypothetical protein [Candidatus Sulfotelmatobacter sp. SbA7]